MAGTVGTQKPCTGNYHKGIWLRQWQHVTRVVVVVVYSQFLYRYKQTQSAKTRFRQAGARQRVVNSYHNKWINVRRLNMEFSEWKLKFGRSRQRGAPEFGAGSGAHWIGGAGFEPTTSTAGKRRCITNVAGDLPLYHRSPHVTRVIYI